MHETFLTDENVPYRLTFCAAPQSQDLWEPFSLQPVMKKARDVNVSLCLLNTQ